MPVNQKFLDHVLEQMNRIDDVSHKKMFGGAGIYIQGKIIGIISEASLFFKVNENNSKRYLEKGMGPFKPYKDKPMKMPYYEVPPEVLENRDDLEEWAMNSLKAIYDL